MDYIFLDVCREIVITWQFQEQILMPWMGIDALCFEGIQQGLPENL